ncbi:MAG TPA: amidohydrolase family protein [Acidimicrobiia bacterium]
MLTIHDADAHIVELPDAFIEVADPGIRDRMRPLYDFGISPGEADLLTRYKDDQEDPEYRARDADEIWLRKNWKATGSFIKKDRPEAIDLLGVKSQLIFSTFFNGALCRAELGDDVEYAYGIARAHNRVLADFCSVDPRLLPVGYVPLADFDRSAAMAREALEMGAKAFLVPSACPRTHSPSHIGLDPVWATAQEAGIPVVFHVGGGGQLLDPHYFDNGLPPVPDFHGGDGNFRSVDYIAIQYPVMQTLGVLIIDGVLDRFPDLKFGVIEQGASWLPGLMRTLDSAADAFRKNEERLQKLALEPSEYVQRQVRVTPYPHEDAGWIVEQTGPSVCMFSSDYPHVEGGRNPLGRFARSLEGVSQVVRDAFYADNFIDMMGAGLAPELR